MATHRLTIPTWQSRIHLARSLHTCCLTPRSSGAPTAGHQARSGGTRYIFASPGLASCRCRPLSSNVRPRMANSVECQQSQRLRRELNSHETSGPHEEYRILGLSDPSNRKRNEEDLECQKSLQRQGTSSPVLSAALRGWPRISSQLVGPPRPAIPRPSRPRQRRLEGTARQGLQRGAGSHCGGPARKSKPARPNPILLP
jgi:hypothetical protein